MKNILLITDGIFHPPLLARWVLRRMLATMGGFSFKHIPSFERLLTIPHLDRFDAMVVYLHRQTITPRALGIFGQFVTRGGGLLGIHSATASFMHAAHYFEIIGGQFVGHEAIEPFCSSPVPGADNPFDGLPELTVKDELYIHDLQPGIEPRYQAMHEGKPVPIVWTCRYGAGKVCYAVPGHSVATMQNATYQEILKRGLTWVSG